jgi:hypothetical protein
MLFISIESGNGPWGIHCAETDLAEPGKKIDAAVAVPSGRSNSVRSMRIFASSPT